MEKFEPTCPWHIQVGDMFIAPGKVPNTGTVWVGQIDGEGGEFKTAELEKVLQKFFYENF